MADVYPADSCETGGGAGACAPSGVPGACAPSGVPAAESAVAIIGFGTAGVSALIALRTAGYKGTVRVFSNHNTLPYSPILTSDYAGGTKTYAECFPWSAEELEALSAELYCNCPVLRLNVEAQTLDTTLGTFAYSKCIIATGATPTGWQLEAGGYEPLVLRTLDDAKRLKTALEHPGCKRVLVSGASLVALKTLEACLEHGCATTLVGVSPHVLDFNALPQTAERFEAGLRRLGVRLVLGHSITAVQVLHNAAHPLGRELEVSFSSGETARFDEIAIAHGMQCNLAFVAEGSLALDRALLVDDCMRTSNPQVYAAGDVAQALELISGAQRVVGIWKNAAVQGAVAGKAVAAALTGGELSLESRYPGSISTNAIAVKDTLFISAGTMELSSARRVELHEDNEMTIASIFQTEAEGPERLVGFSLTCDTNEAGSKAYDLGALLTLRIERAALRAAKTSTLWDKRGTDL